MKLGFRWLWVAALVVLACPAVSEARIFGRRNSSYTYSTPVTPVRTAAAAAETATAQGVANIMARMRRVGHWGGNRGYEGCGSGFSQQHAYNNCCYANSGMTTVDVGYAQAGGMWYCCRRYR